MLIADEIQSGFGRTGQRFAFSWLGIEPDLILLGKKASPACRSVRSPGANRCSTILPKRPGGTYSGNSHRPRRCIGDAKGMK